MGTNIPMLCFTHKHPKVQSETPIPVPLRPRGLANMRLPHILASPKGYETSYMLTALETRLNEEGLRIGTMTCRRLPTPLSPPWMTNLCIWPSNLNT